MFQRPSPGKVPGLASPAGREAGGALCVRREPSSLTEREIRIMIDIVVRYFPDPARVERVVRAHLVRADSLRLALQADRLIGFSIASAERLATPFSRRPLPVLFQRMLFIEPGSLFAGIGQRLLIGSITDLLGTLWPFKSFVVVCRTQNPVVAELIGLFNRFYPAYGRPVPAEVRAFGERLLPLLGAQSLDAEFRLIGALQGFEGADFSDTWRRYFQRDGGPGEQLMLHTAFERSGQRIVNRGVFVLMIGYARPLRFLGRLVRLAWRGCAVRRAAAAG